MKSFVLTAFEQKWQVRVEEHAKLDTGGGCFDPDSRSIYINPHSKHEMQVAILLHEIMHLIEYYWDFDLGKHKVFDDLELVGLLEEGLFKIYRENKLKFP